MSNRISDMTRDRMVTDLLFVSTYHGYGARDMERMTDERLTDLYNKTFNPPAREKDVYKPADGDDDDFIV